MNASLHTTTSFRSRQYYQDILGQSVNLPTFYAQLAVILDADPYFMPAHLEMLWNAEERNDRYLYKKVADNVLRPIQNIIVSSSLRAQLSETWTTLEIECLQEIAHVLQKNRGVHMHQALMLRAVEGLAQRFIVPKTHSSNTSSRFLIKKRSLDISRLKEELATISPYWWQVNTARREGISHHQHTWSIALRSRAATGTAFEKIDGEHESVATELASRFPRMHEHVLELAEELQLGLGRVVVVMMKPWTQSYRHYDAEPFLVGRDRYHLVLQCGINNILSSGPESVVAQEGELWFFDNKAMHRAHNKSSVPRIHIIFDGKQLP